MDPQTSTTKTSWLTSAAPLIGAGIDFLSSAGSSLFNLNQARKNRAFQERMYKQQVQDNLHFWNLQNEYNLPKNVLARMESAGINPLLYYGEGGTSLTSTNMAQSANAPSGDSARGSFQTNFGQAALQSALLKAQIQNINADTAQKTAAAEESGATTENLKFDVAFKRLTQSVDYASKIANLDLLNANVRDINSQIWNRNTLTNQQVLSLIQTRDLEIRRFHWDLSYQGQLLEQGWESVKQGWQNVSANLQNAAAAMIHARSAAQLSSAQVALFAQEYAFNVKANPIRLDTLEFQKLAAKAGWKTEQARTFEREFKNKMLYKFGAEQLPQSYTTLSGFVEQFKQATFNIMDPRWWLSPIGTYNHKK